MQLQTQYAARWYQNEAVAAFFSYFERGGKGNPIIAMPGGTGKSLVIAMMIESVLKQYPDQRVMMLTHDKRLISQNAEKLKSIWPAAPLGIHSAGLNSREIALPVIFGGVKSVANSIIKAKASDWPHHFGHRDLIFIDECHLISPDAEAQYQFIFNELKEINSSVKIIGLSATPYRLKSGHLTESGLFTDVCYDVTDMRSFSRFFAEGFLSPLIVKPTETFIDLEEIGLKGGEYNQQNANRIIDKDDLVLQICKEIIASSYNRNCWMIFSQSIENAEHINEVLQALGVNSTVVHSKEKRSDERIAAFKNGDFQCIVNKDMLTVGFDHPPIDLIADCQPTMSAAKHVQKWSRGTRPAPWAGKVNCLGLDFARNASVLGPINDPVLPKSKKAGGGTGDAPIKQCEFCNFYAHPSARVCEQCGEEFSFKVKLYRTAGTHELIKTEEETRMEYFDVNTVIYNTHVKEGSPPSMKVTYFCGLNKSFNEWVCFEHSGAALRMAHQWWHKHHASDPPLFTYEAIRLSKELKKPKQIKVHLNGKYPSILAHEF